MWFSGKTISKWLLLSRAQFFSVGVLPFILGTIAAAKTEGVFSFPVFLFSLTAVILIMVAANLSGEVYDLVEDRFSALEGKSSFSGGSQIAVKDPGISPLIKRAIKFVIIVTFIIGLVLQFYFRTGPWTLALGMSGIIAAFFYSKPPLRLVNRGLGELIIAYCYGWLPVAAAFYLQAQTIKPVVYFMAIPIACAIFNVILINEFPDYTADTQARKRNLLVRIGKIRGAYLYITVAIISWSTFCSSIFLGAPVKSGLFYFPALFISTMVCIMMLKKIYESRTKLVRMCGFTIAVNLLTTLAYIIGFIWK